MSEIPMYPNELDCPCGIGEHANPWQCAAHLRERLKAVENSRDHYQQIWTQLCEMVAEMCKDAGADEDAMLDAWTLAALIRERKDELRVVHERNGRQALRICDLEEALNTILAVSEDDPILKKARAALGPMPSNSVANNPMVSKGSEGDEG